MSGGHLRLGIASVAVALLIAGAGNLYAFAEPAVACERQRQERVQDLVERFPRLTAQERQQLKELGSAAFGPLFYKWLDWDREFREKRYATTLSKEELAKYDTLFSDAYAVLEATCSAEETGGLMWTLRELPKESRLWPLVNRLLTTKGDESTLVSKVISDLKRKKPSEDDERNLRFISLSQIAEVRQFFSGVLKDNRAIPIWRIAAIVYLSGKEDKKTLAIVRKFRAKPVERSPLLGQVELAARKNKSLAELPDARGDHWVLYQDEALGYEYDLFVARKEGNKLEGPLFTGLWTRGIVDRGNPPNNYSVSVEQLVSGEWIHRLPDDPTLRKDTDGDGLTDLVESRLGTDPSKKDTDDDGRRDDVDRFPNATPRKMGDLEKIVAACVEASFFEEKSLSPALISAPVKPFEFAGYDGLVLWYSEKTGELSKCWGGGVTSIGFISPKETAWRSDPDIEISADKKTAHTQISISGGPLGGKWTEMTLKKFGNDWYVVDWAVRAVS
jgi:hypothetical protein